MPGSRSSNNESEHKSPRESGDDSEDESEILEESPCGRWLKRKEEVSFVFKVLVDSGEFKFLLSALFNRFLWIEFLSSSTKNNKKLQLYTTRG